LKLFIPRTVLNINRIKPTWWTFDKHI